jgi:hypothetical protein
MAELTLPSPGEWEWGIRAFGGQTQPMPPIVVATALRSNPLGNPAPPVAGVTLGLLSAALAAVGILFAFRRRFVFSGIAILL